MIMETIKIGTEVIYRPAWGKEQPTKAKIVRIEKCSRIGDKYGRKVEEISWSDKDYGCFALDNRHWCYGYQIDKIVKRHKVKLIHKAQRWPLEKRGCEPISLTIYLSDEELDTLFDCMDEFNDDGTMALYRFTHSKECSKHHRYLIWNTFEAGDIRILVID